MLSMLSIQMKFGACEVFKKIFFNEQNFQFTGMLNSVKTIAIILIWLGLPVVVVKYAIERIINSQIDWLTPALLVFAAQWIVLSAVSLIIGIILDKINENRKLRR